MKMFITGVALAVVVAAGIVYTGLYDVAASSPHNAVTEWLFSTAMHASVARQARDIEMPDLRSEELRLVGISDFDAMCAGCHGAPGRKSKAAGPGLNPQPSDLTESAAKMSPAELFWITKYGIRMTGMPAWGATHDDESLWPVIAFMTELPRLDAAAYNAMLVRAEGRGHHAADAKGHNHGDSPPATDAANAGTEVAIEAVPAEGKPNHGHSGHSH